MVFITFLQSINTLTNPNALIGIYYKNHSFVSFFFMKMPQNDNTFGKHVIRKITEILSCCVIHHLSEKIHESLHTGKYFKAVITIFTLFLLVFL